MKQFLLTIIAVLSTAGFLLAPAVEAFSMDAGLRAWPVDSLIKVLPSARPPAGLPSRLSVDAVRNEYESAQIVVLSDTRVEKLTVSVGGVSESFGARGERRSMYAAGCRGSLPRVTTNFVGYVHIEKGTPETPPERLAFKAPVDAPDPLLEVSSVSLEAGRARAIWLTVYVPKNTQPGTYSAKIQINADGQSVQVPLSIRVHNVTLPDKRKLMISNWFFPEIIARVHGLTEWSEPHWKMLNVYAHFMADHRQTSALTPTLALVKRGKDAEGRPTFDFTDFDRWVELFKKAGFTMFEGGGLGQTAPSDRAQYEAVPVGLASDMVIDAKTNVRLDSEQYKQFVSEFFPALQGHLKAKGWLGIYYQHLCDEPSPNTAASYNKFAALVKHYAPKIKVLEACMAKEVAGSVNVWVVQPQHYDQFRDFLEGRRRAGDTLWFYTCCGPRGLYPNRFIDFPLLDVRLMHWENFKFSLPGYLHWGFNFWRGDPFNGLEKEWEDGTFLPAGDTHIVYPGANGPLSSIRLEAMRDGIEDYELLKLLSKKHPAKAHGICDSVVKSFTDFTTDPVVFRAARGRLIQALEKQ
jgi:hypothetical protein